MKTIKTGGFTSTRFLLSLLACYLLSCTGAVTHTERVKSPSQQFFPLTIGGQTIPKDTFPISDGSVCIGGVSTPKSGEPVPPAAQCIGENQQVPAPGPVPQPGFCPDPQNQDKPREPLKPSRITCASFVESLTYDL